MANTKGVVDFRPNTIAEALEELLKMAKQGYLKSFVLAGFTDDPENTVMCTMGLDVVQQQHLASFIQIETNERHWDERTVTHVIADSDLRRMGINPEDLDNDDDDE